MRILYIFWQLLVRLPNLKTIKNKKQFLKNHKSPVLVRTITTTNKPYKSQHLLNLIRAVHLPILY